METIGDSGKSIDHQRNSYRYMYVPIEMSSDATKTELTQGLEKKQDVGSYVTKTDLSNGLNTKQNSGSYRNFIESSKDPVLSQ